MPAAPPAAPPADRGGSSASAPPLGEEDSVIDLPELLDYYEGELLVLGHANRSLRDALERGSSGVLEGADARSLQEKLQLLEHEKSELERKIMELERHSPDGASCGCRSNSGKLPTPPAQPSAPAVAAPTADALARLEREKQSELERVRREKDEEIASLTRRLNGLQESLSSEVQKQRSSLEEQHQAEMSSLQSVLENDVNQIAQLYIHERDKRREYYDKLVEIRGNIRVLCRARPVDPSSSDSDSILSFPIPGEVVLMRDNKEVSYEYDIAYNGSSHEDIYQEIQQYIQCVLDGFNLCFFAYGGRGSGKTFSLLGSEDSPGLVRLSLAYLFDLAYERNECVYTFIISAVNIYRDKYTDLLTPPHTSKLCDVRETENGMYLDGVSEVLVSTAEDLDFTLKKIREVQAKIGSSHYPFSHMVISLVVKATSMLNEEVTLSKLHFIELASNQSPEASLPSETRADILCVNQTYSALSTIITQLSHRTKYIPYRHSKLTAYLQDSLKLSSKILIMACISSSKSDLEVTQRTLESCSKLRRVDMEVAPRPVQLSTPDRSLKTEVLDLGSPTSRRVPFVSTYDSIEIPIRSRFPASERAAAIVAAGGERSDRSSRSATSKTRSRAKVVTIAVPDPSLAEADPSYPPVQPSSEGPKGATRPRRPLRSGSKSSTSKSLNAARKPSSAAALPPSATEAADSAVPSTAPVSKATSFLMRPGAARPHAV